MKKRPALIAFACVMTYVASYFALRSYSAIYAPYAWGRGYETVNPTPSTIHYPVFSKRHASGFEKFEQRYLRPLAYYAFSPLVEWDLSIRNHPLSHLPRWEFYGNNWPK